MCLANRRNTHRERGRGLVATAQRAWQSSLCQTSRFLFAGVAEIMNRTRSLWLVLLTTVAAGSCHASYPVAPTEPTPLSFQIYYRSPVSLATVGSSYVFDAYTLRSDGAYEDVTSQTTWSSSNPAVLRHNPVSSSTGAVFNAVATGPADVIARYRGLSSSRADVRHTVGPAGVSAALYRTATVPAVDRGTDKAQANCKCAEQIGAPAFEVVTDLASWSSSNPDVLRVERGAWTVIAPGTAHITASYNGLSALIGVSVHPPRQAQ